MIREVKEMEDAQEEMKAKIAELNQRYSNICVQIGDHECKIALIRARINSLIKDSQDLNIELEKIKEKK